MQPIFSYHFEETTSSLKFAQRVKHIKNKVKINIKLSYEELHKIIAELRKKLGLAQIEIKKLREFLKWMWNWKKWFVGGF